MYCILITIPWFLCNKRFKYDIDLDPDSDEQGDDDDDDDEDICSYPLATTALDEEEGDNGPLISFHIEGVVESNHFVEWLWLSLWAKMTAKFK